jgi:hypothetical protein
MLPEPVSGVTENKIQLLTDYSRKISSAFTNPRWSSGFLYTRKTSRGRENSLAFTANFT